MKANLLHQACEGKVVRPAIDRHRRVAHDDRAAALEIGKSGGIGFASLADGHIDVEEALIFEHLDQMRGMLLYITTEAEPSAVIDAISPDSDGEVSILLDGRWCEGAYCRGCATPSLYPILALAGKWSTDRCGRAEAFQISSRCVPARGGEGLQIPSHLASGGSVGDQARRGHSSTRKFEKLRNPALLSEIAIIALPFYFTRFPNFFAGPPAEPTSRVTDRYRVVAQLEVAT